MIPGINTWFHADWAPEQPYQDYARKSRWPEIGDTGVKLSGTTYDIGVTYRCYLSTAGAIPAGNYDLSWSGGGALTVTPTLGGDVTLVSGTTYTLGTGNIWVEFTPSSTVNLDQLAIHLYEEGQTPTTKWHADWLSDLEPFRGCFRAMDWCGAFSAIPDNNQGTFFGQTMEPGPTSYGGVSTWSEDPGVKPDSFDVPNCEYLWLNVPFRLCEGTATDGAQWLADRVASVPSGTHVFASVANECWNDSFAAAQLLKSQAIASPVAGTANEWEGRCVLYMRMVKALKDAVEANQSTSGCVTVIAEWQNAASGSAMFYWSGAPAVQEAYDLLVEVGHMAVAPYFDDGLSSLSQLATAMDTALTDLATWKVATDAAGAKLHLYEFGQHVTNQDPSWQASSEMALAILDYIPRVDAILDSDAVACWYTLTSPWATGGSWGLNERQGEATHKRSAVLDGFGLSGELIGTARIVNRTNLDREGCWTTVLPMRVPVPPVWTAAELAGGIPVSVENADLTYSKKRATAYVQGDAYPGSGGSPKTLRVVWRGEIAAGTTGTGYPSEYYSEKLLTFRAEPAQAYAWAMHSSVAAAIDNATTRIVWTYRSGELGEIMLRWADRVEIEPEPGHTTDPIIRAYRVRGRYVPADPTSAPSLWAELDFEVGHDVQQIPWTLRIGNSRIEETTADGWHRTTAGVYQGVGVRDLNIFSNSIGVLMENVPFSVVEGATTKLQQPPIQIGPAWFFYAIRPEFGTGPSSNIPLQRLGDFSGYVVDGSAAPIGFWQTGSTQIGVKDGSGDFVAGDTIQLHILGEYRVTQNHSGPGILQIEPPLRANVINGTAVNSVTKDNCDHALLNDGMTMIYRGTSVFASLAGGLEDSTAAAELTDPAEAIATTWLEREHVWGPHGVVPPIPRNSLITSDAQARIRAAEQAQDDLDEYTDRKHPWFRPIHGDKPDSTAQGGSNVYGVMKGWHLVASGQPDFRALKISVAQEGCRQREYREDDLSIFKPANRPGVSGQWTANYFWSCRPLLGTNLVYQGSPQTSGVPNNHTLGKGEDEPRWKPKADRFEAGPVEWQSYDWAHYDINWVGALAMLTGDRMARRELEIQEQVLLASLWPVEETGSGTLRNLTGIYTMSNRAEARRLQSAMWCFRVTGNEAVRTQVKQRHANVHLPTWRGGSPATVLKSFGALDEPQGFTWYHHTVWQCAMVVASLNSWYLVTGTPSFRVMAQLLAHSIARYCNRKNSASGGKRELADAILYEVDGVPGGVVTDDNRYGPWSGRYHGLAASEPDTFTITSGDFTEGGAIQVGQKIWTRQWGNSSNNSRPRSKTNTSQANWFPFTVESVSAQTITIAEKVIVNDSGTNDAELWDADGFGNQWAKWDTTLQSWAFASVLLSWEWAREIGDTAWEADAFELIRDQVPSAGTRTGPHGWDQQYDSSWTDWLAVVSNPFKSRSLSGGTVNGEGDILGQTTIVATGEATEQQFETRFGTAAVSGAATVTGTGAAYDVLFGTGQIYIGPDAISITGTPSAATTIPLIDIKAGSADVAGGSTVTGDGTPVTITIQQGSGAVAGGSTVAGSGVAANPTITVKHGVAAMAGSGTIAGIGRHGIGFGVGAVAGAATLAGTGTAEASIGSGAGAIVGAGTVTGAGTLITIEQGSGAVAGGSTVTGAGTAIADPDIQQGVGAITGGASVAAAGLTVAFGSAAVAGAATITGQLSEIIHGTAAIVGSEFITATGRAADLIQQATAAIVGGSVLTATGVDLLQQGVGAITGSATIAATGTRRNNARVLPPTSFTVMGRLEPGSDNLFHPAGYVHGPDLRVSQDGARWELRMVTRAVLAGAEVSEPDHIQYSQIGVLTAQFATDWGAPEIQQIPRSAEEFRGVGPCSVIWVPPLCSLVSYYESLPGARTSGTGSISTIKAAATTQTLGKRATWCRIGTIVTPSAAGEQGYQTSSGAWAGGVTRPSAVWRADTAQVLLFTNGVSSGAASAVYRRVSNDGVNFTLSPTPPVFNPGGTGHQARVTADPDGQTLHMMRRSGPSYEHWTSLDWGLTWQKNPASPVLTLATAGVPSNTPDDDLAGAMLTVDPTGANFVLVFEFRPDGVIGKVGLEGGIYYALATRSTT